MFYWCQVLLLGDAVPLLNRLETKADALETTMPQGGSLLLPARLLSIALTLLAFSLLITGCGVFQPGSGGAGTGGDPADDECREDLACWIRAHKPNAESLCKPMIEDRAPFGHKWLVRPGATVLTGSYSFWNAKVRAPELGIPADPSIAVYTGTKVSFKTGGGGRRVMRYTCYYKPGPYRDSGHVERLIVEPLRR